ncbi:hypothetical protein BH11ARM2_BH11ARM2_24200 [soil metagenome]
MTRLAFLAVVLAAGLFASQAEKPKPTGFGAVSYFEDRCARCHGPQGSFFTADFAKGQDDEKLAASTKAMCDGPGGAPLKEEELKVEVAYMRAVSEGKTFIVWTSDKDKFDGETSAEKLTATVDGKPVSVEVKDGAWSLPKGGKVVLESGEGQKAVRLALDEANVSQSVTRNEGK